MGVLDRFESSVEDAFDKAGARIFKGTIEPAQIARKAEKQMKREKLVSTGKQFAPTLYTVLVSARDDKRLFAFYPTMAAEIESFLMSRGADASLTFDGRPLVRFIVDKKLKNGRFDVIAESVAASIIVQLRQEEAEYLGIKSPDSDSDSDSDSEQNIIESQSADAYQSQLPSAYQVDAESNLRAAIARVHGNAVNSAAADSSAADSSAADSSAADVAVQAASGGVAGDLSPAVAGIAAERDSDQTDYSVATNASGYAMVVDHQSGQSFQLSLTKMTIGRDADNNIVLDDANASRRHAVLSQNALGVWKITDLQSTNGTLVNGRVVDQMVLRANDQLTIGVTVLEFVKGQEMTNQASGSAGNLSLGSSRLEDSSR